MFMDTVTLVAVLKCIDDHDDWHGFDRYVQVDWFISFSFHSTLMKCKCFTHNSCICWGTTARTRLKKTKQCYDLSKEDISSKTGSRGKQLACLSPKLKTMPSSTSKANYLTCCDSFVSSTHKQKCKNVNFWFPAVSWWTTAGCSDSF